MPRDRVAAIDCGTNSIRLLVADITDGTMTELVREMRIVRLGQEVDATGRLASGAIERTLGATREYAELIVMLGADEVRFCATSAARDAENADEFADGVESILGVRPQVLSGEEEALASFIGATRGLDPHRALVVDIGGGSTELVVGDGSDVEWSTSLDIGSVRLSERFLPSDPPPVREVTTCMNHLDVVLAPAVAGLEPVESVVGVAGTVTTVAAHALGLPSYDRDAIHGARLSVDDVRGACLSLVQMSVADRRALPFMHPGRADVIGGGALVLDRVLEQLPLDTGTVIVSEHDILDGIAWGAV
ncbi:exopolyphosphatase [Aeromicrobium sp.]|uniref:Ppx/GppA phosphatase family protein n=1 Tax=Aeromicrobium sp. TaxID=1871063 RepID=UPI003D6C345C